MPKKIILYTAAGLLFLLLAADLPAASSALPFLRIAPSARTEGMGETFTALADDVDAVFWNPAGLANLEFMEASLTHMLYWDSSTYDYAAFSYPLSDRLRLGAHIIYMSYGPIDKISETPSGSIGTVSGTFTPADLALAVSAGYLLNKDIQVGATVKYALQTIDTSSASAFAADLGVLLRLKMLEDNLVFGAALSNLGTQISGDNLPLTARGGFSDKFKLIDPADLTVAVTAYYPFDTGKLAENLGLEFWYQKNIAFRLGYKIGYDTGNLTIGLGYKDILEGVFGYEIDYAYAASGNLGDTHRFSVVFFLDAENSKTKNSGGKANKGIRTFP